MTTTTPDTRIVIHAEIAATYDLEETDRNGAVHDGTPGDDHGWWHDLDEYLGREHTDDEEQQWLAVYAEFVRTSNEAEAEDKAEDEAAAE